MACRSAQSISRSWPDGQVSNVAPLLLGVFSSMTLGVSAARVWSNDVADRAREAQLQRLLTTLLPETMQACAGTSGPASLTRATAVGDPVAACRQFQKSSRQPEHAVVPRRASVQNGRYGACPASSATLDRDPVVASLCSRGHCARGRTNADRRSRSRGIGDRRRTSAPHATASGRWAGTVVTSRRRARILDLLAGHTIRLRPSISGCVRLVKPRGWW